MRVIIKWISPRKIKVYDGLSESLKIKLVGDEPEKLRFDYNSTSTQKSMVKFIYFGGGNDQRNDIIDWLWFFLNLIV